MSAAEQRDERDMVSVVLSSSNAKMGKAHHIFGIRIPGVAEQPCSWCAECLHTAAPYTLYVRGTCVCA